MQHDQQSPVETPITPSSPCFPPLSAILTSFTHRKQSSTQSVVSTRRKSSIISVPASPIENTTVRPTPLRPDRVTKSLTPPEVAPASTPRPASPDVRSGSRCSTRTQHYHLQVRTEREKKPVAAFEHVLDHLATPLVPLISVTSGQPHPSFPTSLLQFHLLAHKTLDELARYYHQVTPAVDETFRYPACVPAWVDREGREVGRRVGLETKRRRWGRFVGLRGCESPVVENAAEVDVMDVDGRESVEEEMEREWRRALQRAREEEESRDKSWRGRW